MQSTEILRLRIQIQTLSISVDYKKKKHSEASWTFEAVNDFSLQQTIGKLSVAFRLSVIKKYQTQDLCSDFKFKFKKKKFSLVFLELSTLSI